MPGVGLQPPARSRRGAGPSRDAVSTWDANMARALAPTGPPVNGGPEGYYELGQDASWSLMGSIRGSHGGGVFPVVRAALHAGGPPGRWGKGPTDRSWSWEVRDRPDAMDSEWRNTLCTGPAAAASPAYINRLALCRVVGSDVVRRVAWVVDMQGRP